MRPFSSQEKGVRDEFVVLLQRLFQLVKLYSQHVCGMLQVCRFIDAKRLAESEMDAAEGNSNHPTPQVEDMICMS